MRYGLGASLARLLGARCAQPVAEVVRGQENMRSSDLLTSSSTTVASCGMSASGRVCGGAASARASGESSTVVYNFVAASGDPSPACACSSCRQVHHASSAAYQKSTAFPQLCLVPVSSVLFTAAGSSISLAY